MKAVLLILRVATSARGLLQTVAALAILFSAALAFAHELRPAYLELREEKPGEFSVLWKTPMLGEGRLSLEPEFSGDAKAVTPVTTSMPPGAAIQEWTLRAPALRGQTLRIRGLEGTMTDALVRIEFADGTKWVQRLTGQEPSAIIPMRQSGWSVAGVYLKLGVEHILFGADHMLFVLGLLLIVKDRWMLLKTITAFTVAHSITLTRDTGLRPHPAAAGRGSDRVEHRFRRRGDSARPARPRRHHRPCAVGRGSLVRTDARPGFCQRA